MKTQTATATATPARHNYSDAEVRTFIQIAKFGLSYDSALTVFKTFHKGTERTDVGIKNKYANVFHSLQRFNKHKPAKENLDLIVYDLIVRYPQSNVSINEIIRNVSPQLYKERIELLERNLFNPADNPAAAVNNESAPVVTPAPVPVPEIAPAVSVPAKESKDSLSLIPIANIMDMIHNGLMQSATVVIDGIEITLKKQ